MRERFCLLMMGEEVRGFMPLFLLVHMRVHACKCVSGMVLSKFDVIVCIYNFL